MRDGVPEGALYIASRCIRDGATLPVREPWSDAELGRVVLANAAHAEEAIAASVRAFARIQERTPFERKLMLERVAQEIESRREVFAELIAREAGKPIALARAEASRAAMTFRLAAEEATRMGGEVIPLDITPNSRGATGICMRVAAGPVVGIAPFNFPLNLVAH